MAQKPPPFVICYLCGRKYGTKSIVIHEPSCMKKWYAENKKLPKHLRRKLPTKPDYSKLSSGDYDGNYIDQVNEMSYKAAQEQLIPCGFCGRTFLPERLQVHQKSCTAEKALKAPRAATKSKPLQNTNEDEPNSYNANNEPLTTSSNSSEKAVHKYKLCCLCMKEVPQSVLKNHLVRCNDTKIQELNNSGDSNIEDSGPTKIKNKPQSQEKRNNKSTNLKVNDQSSSRSLSDEHDQEEIERPSTRTLKKKPPPNISNGTYDIDSPDEDYSPPKPSPKPKQSYPDTNMPSDSQENLSVVPCNLCNRKFAVDRINAHTKICQKTTSKTRKVFDSSKQRAERSDAIFVQKSSNPKQNTPKKQNNWRQQHEEFINSIRNAKQVTKHMANGGKASDLPPPPPSLNPDYVHCQHCDRRFNPEVAKRHIPKCSSTVNRPKPPKQKALDTYKNKKAPPQNNGTMSKPRAKMTTQNNNNSNNNMGNRSPGTYSSPRIERGYQNFDSPPASGRNSRPSKISNDQYKPKTFSGINQRTPSNRGYSYNAMNHTGANFFG